MQLKNKSKSKIQQVASALKKNCQCPLEDQAQLKLRRISGSKKKKRRIRFKLKS
jgi:hypothetical protein